MQAITKYVTGIIDDADLLMSKEEEDVFTRELLIDIELGFDTYLSKCITLQKTPETIASSTYSSIEYNLLSTVSERMSKYAYMTKNKLDLICACITTIFRVKNPDPYLFDGMMFWYRCRNHVYLKNPSVQRATSGQLIHVNLDKLKDLICQDVMVKIERSRNESLNNISSSSLYDFISGIINKSNLELPRAEKEAFVKKVLGSVECNFDCYVNANLRICKKKDFEFNENLTISYDIGSLRSKLNEQGGKISQNTIDLICRSTASLFKLMRPYPSAYDGIVIYDNNIHNIFLKNRFLNSGNVIYFSLDTLRSLITQEIIAHIEDIRNRSKNVCFKDNNYIINYNNPWIVVPLMLSITAGMLYMAL
jgi:hypothetical protein